MTSFKIVENELYGSTPAVAQTQALYRIANKQKKTPSEGRQPKTKIKGNKFFSIFHI